MIEKKAPAWVITIWIAGDAAEAERLCREFCDDVGFCVSVTPTTFTYRGGTEQGVAVGLINYPRFPLGPMDLANIADSLAEHLVAGLGQRSCTVQDPFEAVYRTFEPGEAKTGRPAWFHLDYIQGKDERSAQRD